MSIKLKSILCLGLTLVLASTAHASPKMDINGDEEISRIEYMSFKSNSFNKQDKNFDGRLTKQEIRDARAEGLREASKKRFKKMDTNRDGTITQQEHDDSITANNNKRLERSLEQTDTWFAKLDADNNGNISRLEYDDFLTAEKQRRQDSSLKSSKKTFARMDLDNDGVITEFEYVDRGKVLSGKTSKDAKSLAQRYAHDTAKPKKRSRRDANGDGDITKREDREFNESQFERMDKNKDGALTKKEAAFLFKDYSNTWSHKN